MQDHESNAVIRIKVAEYTQAWMKPVVSEISASSPHDATQQALEKVEAWQAAFEAHPVVPEEALRELIDNLIHAEYKGALISLEGDIVRVADKGPGIEDKERAFKFGYSGAKPEVRQEIRGVGSGLGIARALVEKAGGTVSLDDNLGGGTVATVSMSRKPVPADWEVERFALAGGRTGSHTLEYEDDEGQWQVISTRQMYVLLAVFEGGMVGPTAVAERLVMSTSTAYRDLGTLTEKRLVVQPGEFEAGKYTLTRIGRSIIEKILDMYGEYAPLDESATAIHAALSASATTILDRVREKGLRTFGALSSGSTIDTNDAREDQD